MKKFILLILSIINAVASGVYLAMSPLDIVPSHYNINGEVDAYSSKWFLMLMPCVLILLSVVYFVRCINSQKTKSEDYDENKEFKILVGIFAFLLLLFWYLNIVCVNGTMNISGSLGSLLCISMGALFIYLSNMFGKVKQNKLFGIRISSTLNSKYVWKKTHRLGGYMGVVSGFIMVILGLISIFVNGFNVYLLPIALSVYGILGVIIPIIYSYVIYAKEKSSNNN
jgi:uncharacterized membrane protein